jgi:CheY-like chemotaxis protein
MTSRDRPVLLVEDDADIREGLTDLLRDRGFAVVAAGDGREALALLRGLDMPPSAILLDLMMPIMDGYSFLEERRKDPSLADIPVAIITAGRGVDPRRLAEAIPIVPKPINVPSLFTLLDSLCGARPVAP